MKSIFCTTIAKNNEEYKNIVKNRMKIMVILMVIGIITALAGIIGEFYLKTPVSDKVLGVYTGLGSSFFAAGLVLWIKNLI